MAAQSGTVPAIPPLTRGALALGLLGLEAASLGLAVWLALSGDVLPEYVHDNDVEAVRRRFIFVDMGLALVVACFVALRILIGDRRTGLAALERLSRRLSPLTLVWLVPLVLHRGAWAPEDTILMPLVLALAGGLAVTLRSSWSTAPAFPGLAVRRAQVTERLRARFAHVGAALARVVTPGVVVTVAAVAYAVYFSAFSIVSHRNLRTHGFDLGLEENLLWHAVHGPFPLFESTPFLGPMGNHFGNHATFFSYALAPIYAVAPHPETLLVLQAVLMGAAALPLYLYASLHLSRWTAALVAVAYLLYPPLHGANLYEFHYLPLGVVFLWLTLYAVETNRRALTVVAVVLALSVREDVAACLAVVGLFLLVTGAAARGALIAAVSAAYFVLMKGVLMPHFGATDASFLNQYAGLVAESDSGFGGVLRTLVSNPVFSANVVLDRDKFVYFLGMLTPVLLLPLTRPVGLLLLGPGLAFTLLATGYRPLYQPSFQYTSYWTAFVFVGVVVALEHAGRARFAGDDGGRVRRRALVAGFAAATLACTYLDGAILHRDRVRAGFGRVRFRTSKVDLANRADLGMLVAEIPVSDRVVASDRLLPHVAGRDDAYTLSQGTYDADWLLFQKSLTMTEREVVSLALREGTFGVVDERDTLVLAKRGAPVTENAAALEHLLP